MAGNKKKSSGIRNSKNNPNQGTPQRLSKYVIANIAALDPSARGAKIPDSNMMPSVAVTLVDTFTLTVDANGFAAGVLRADAYDTWCTGQSIDGNGDITWLTSNVLGSHVNMANAPGVTNFQLQRPVGVGYEARYESKYDDVSGSMHIAHGAEAYNISDDYNATTWPTDSAHFESAAVNEEISLRSLAVAPHTGQCLIVSDEAYAYRNLLNVAAPQMNSTALNTKATNGWTYTAFYIKNAVAATVVEIRVVVHLECIALLDLPSYVTPTKALRPNRAVLDAVSIYHSTHRHVKKTSKSSADSTKSFIKEVSGELVHATKDFVVHAGKAALKSKVLPYLLDAIPLLSLIG